MLRLRGEWLQLLLRLLLMQLWLELLLLFRVLRCGRLQLLLLLRCCCR